jgi:hypothetical protein
MKKLFSVLLVVLIATVIGSGQATTSGVTGIVTDKNGAVVPGVKVTLLDTKNGNEQTTTTDDRGVYKFGNVQPGSGFKLTFAGQGFQTFVLSEVQLGIGRIETQNIELTAGQVTESVEVVSTSGDATLNTTDASIGNIISSRQLRELPIQIRASPAALIGLQPGAIGTNVFAGGGNRSGSVTGARADQGNVTVDGIDVNDQAGNFAFATVANAPIDSIQEFRGTTSGPNAIAGRSSGGQTELTTKSGTNEFHGSVREYYRTEKTAANSFFNNRNGVARPTLRRHQYGGSIGGPLPFPHFGEGGPTFNSGKDKLFFFFDAELRRDRSQNSTSRVVPLQTFRDGRIAYVNNNAGCTTTSRVDTTPNCISYQSMAQTQAMDPAGIGVNAALLQFINSRYPLPNDLTGGDGRNTGLLRWNAPNVRDDKIYTARIDGIPTDAQRWFGRVTITRRDSTNALEFLPGDGDSVLFKDKSFVIAGGHTWAITPRFTNAAIVGLTKQVNFFSPPEIASFPNSYSGGPIGSPFPSLSYQDRFVYVPTIRDDMTWIAGNHTFMFGVSYKPIRQDATLRNDFNFVTLGLGGLTTALDASLRPANILAGAVASYDSAFTYLLGRIGALSTNYNLAPDGSALPPGTGKIRSYWYNEYEGYVQDNWKIASSLTLNLGARYHIYPAPYDRFGLQADNTTDFTSFFATRLSNAAAGIASNSSEPFLVYNLSGKANDGTPYYKTDKNNIAPRFGFAWNPSFKNGFLGALMGDRKTVFRGNYSKVFDRVAGAISFIQNQVDYLFASNVARNFGNINPSVALATDPRFTSLASLPVSTTPPSGTRPVTPFVTNGAGTGLATGAFNYTIDHNFEIPEAHTFNFGIQRELPGNMLIDVSYVGRLGRKLFVQSDVAQALNFKDASSGQLMFDALNIIQPLVAANVAAGGTVRAWDGIPAQAWFENQIGPAIAANFPGRNCTNILTAVAGHPVQNCAQFVAAFRTTFVRIGDTSDLIQALNANRVLFNNVGMSSQFSTNAYISNQGNSDYHGLLVSLQRRFSQGLEFEANYTYSKSLDNNSSVVNTVTGGLICDVANVNACRGYSDFDIRHLFNANFIYDLPFGKGRAIGGSANGLVNAFIGGWSLSGIFSARSGLAVGSGTGSFPLGFNLNSPAIVTGSESAFAPNIHNTAAGIQYFDDPVAANAALRFPHHGEVGRRNTFRSANFWGLDMGLSKRFNLPWEGHRITLRADAFNVTNTNAFNVPNLTKDSTSFGLISSSLNSPRELQFALRWDF